MRAYNPDQPLFSLHIPKCAGSSFRKVLESWFGERLHPHYFKEHHARMPERAKLRWPLLPVYRKGMCVHGHFNHARGFGIQDYYPEADQFITILRDPFEVVLSTYFYVRRLGENAYRDGKPLPLGTNPEIQVADYLEQNGRSTLLNFFPFELTLDNYRDLLERHFVYLGISEDLQTSVTQLARRLGKPDMRVETLNVSERTEEIPKGARERFVERNPLEYAIYHFARERYAEDA